MRHLIVLILSSLCAVGECQQIPPVPAEGTTLVLTSDSLQLQPRRQYLEEAATPSATLNLHRGDRMILVQAERDAADSTVVWVELAHESGLSGWTPWATLITAAAPSSPVSRFLHSAVTKRGKGFILSLSLASLLLCLYLMRKSRDIYFIIASGALSATLLLFILCFSSSDARLWHYYLSPTLWPFAPGLPLQLRILLLLLWADVVLWLAALLSLRGGTVLVCARCGHPLKSDAEKCPHCGAINKKQII